MRRGRRTWLFVAVDAVIGALLAQLLAAWWPVPVLVGGDPPVAEWDRGGVGEMLDPPGPGERPPPRTVPLGSGSAAVYSRACPPGEGGDDGIGQLQIVILSEEYSWDFGSEIGVNLVGEPVDFRELLRSSGLKTRLDGAAEVIAVGTASCEGGLREEERRAHQRAKKLKGWIEDVWEPREAGGGPRTIHKLNLGRHVAARPCERAQAHRTRDQRPVILIAVSRTPRVRLGSCLCSVLSEDPRLRHLVQDYSLFVFDSVDPDDRRSSCGGH